MRKIESESRLSQQQIYEIARREIAGVNADFMALVNCESNPLTREDLASNIARRPALWERFSGFLKTLPTRADVDARASA